MAFSSFTVAPRYHLLNPNSPLPSPNPNSYIPLHPTSSLTYHFKINTINPRTLCHTKTHKTRALSLSDQQPLSSSSATTPKMILICFAVTILLAVANRVLYKLALVPLKQYPFFLAQFSTFGAVQACASIVKEFIFIDGGKSVNIFVVNSFGSGFQAIFVLLFLPFLSNLKGIPFAELPAYMRSGVACFLNMGSIQGCDGAPVLPMLYVLTNMAFNISLLNLVKISSAVIASLAMTLSVPISIYILSLPLPYLPGGSCLSSSFLLGTAVLITGLFFYNLPQLIKLDSRAD